MRFRTARATRSVAYRFRVHERHSCCDVEAARQANRLEPRRDVPEDAIGRRWSWVRILTRSVIALAVIYVGLTAVRVYWRNYYLFLPDYVRWTFTTTPASPAPKHIFVLFTDHWEPDYDLAKARRWADRYTALASRHRDRDGRPPQHTWFYPGEQYAPAILDLLRNLTIAGLGEVELHYHHKNDTEASLRAKLQQAIVEFQQFGFLKTASGDTRFAFVHGNFGLDNSIGPGMCGVSTELKLLRELGCFADFSLPSVYRDSQPDIVNAIYAAKDDDSPKSYRTRLPLSRLRDGSADLMMFEGPLVFAPTLNVRRLLLDLDDGNIHAVMPASAARVERWVRANVHVPERPDWIFIKLWAHGVSTAEDEEEVVGPHFDEMLTELERHYNDGTHYVLHYITAREAYNLAMAASRGVAGLPAQYADIGIEPYLTGSRRPVRQEGVTN